MDDRMNGIPLAQSTSSEASRVYGVRVELEGVMIPLTNSRNDPAVVSP